MSHYIRFVHGIYSMMGILGIKWEYCTIVIVTLAYFS